MAMVVSDQNDDDLDDDQDLDKRKDANDKMTAHRQKKSTKSRFIVTNTSKSEKIN